jgi:hypothetical protein
MLSFLKPTLSFLKKVFLVVAVYFIVITLFSHFINKDKSKISPISQISPIEQNRKEIYKVINDKELNKTKEGKLTIALYKMSMCSMIGEACTDNPADADKNYKKSVFGFMSNLIIIPYANPPASGVMWAYEGLQNAGFVPKTMAAEGIGFAAIKPFSNLWKIFRDLSYMLLVIVLIAIGFMIMFRAKINPQTVISVENALPKIVIALILITFSFAIVGFLIDLMYIIIGITVSVLIKNPTVPNQVTTFKNEYMMANAWDLFRDIRLRLGSQSLGAILGSAFTQIIPLPIYLTLRAAGGIIFIFIMKWVFSIVPENLADIVGIRALAFGAASLGSVLKAFFSLSFFPVFILIIFFIGFIYVIPWVISLLIGFSVLFLFFRIFFILFTSYLKLIINIIVAPLLLLFEAVPGKNAFKYWLLNIIGCLIPFPIIIFVFLLGYLIITDSYTTGMTARLPYLYGIDSNSFRMLIGVGIIFLIPDFIKTIKEALGIKELPFNVGVGTFFGGVAAGVGGATGILGQFGSLALAINYLPGGRNLLAKIAGDKAGTDTNPHVRPQVGGGGPTGQTTQ